MIARRAGFDPTQPLVVSKPGFKVGREYEVGEAYEPTPDVTLRQLRFWYDYGWLTHPVTQSEVVGDVAPLLGDGPEPPTPTDHTEAPVVSKSGKVRIYDRLLHKIRWVSKEEAVAHQE